MRHQTRRQQARENDDAEHAQSCGERQPTCVRQCDKLREELSLAKEC